jgi:hypothetical protein
VGSGKPDYGLFVGILFGIASVFFFVLQSNGIEVNSLWSAVIYAACTFVLVWTLFVHALPGRRWAGVFIGVLVLLLCGVLGVIGTTKQFRKEHPSSVAAIHPQQPQTPNFEMQNLSINTGSDSDQKTLTVLIGGLLENQNGPLSAARDWKIDLRIGVRNYEAVLATPTNREVRFIKPDGKAFFALSSQWWPTSTALPLAIGVPSWGWIRGVFPNASLKEIGTSGGDVTVSFVDVATGGFHSAIRHVAPFQVPDPCLNHQGVVISDAINNDADVGFHIEGGGFPCGLQIVRPTNNRVKQGFELAGPSSQSSQERPQSIPGVMPPARPSSAYVQACAASKMADGFNTSWKQGIFISTGSDGQPRPPNKLSSEDLRKLNEGTNESWRNQKQLFTTARAAAISRLRGNLSPNDLSESEQAFNSAMKKAEEDEMLFADLSNNTPDRGRFEPLANYFKKLCDALANLPENPTPQ